MIEVASRGNKLLKFINVFFQFCLILFQRRYVISQLSLREIKLNYTGSLLGPVWLIMEPVVLLCVLWLIFGFGLKGGGGSSAYPFIVYLSSGLMIWMFFSQSLISSANLISKYEFLVKRINFNLSILPIVNIISMVVTHVIMVVIVIIISVLNDIKITPYFIQVFYYLSCACVLLLGLGWIVSALNVFIKDVSKFSEILMRIGFWLTPIFWDINIIPEKYHIAFYLNPVFYIINGYRDSIMYNIGIWNHPWWSLYFWVVTLFVLIFGALIFIRLKPHFAHVI